MPSDHTRSAILSAAERLYADRGFGDVTLMAMMERAGIPVLDSESRATASGSRGSWPM